MLPYGTNSGSDGWVSLWVDKVKVLREEFYCPAAPETCDLVIRLTSRGLELCRRDFESISDPPFKSPGKLKCFLTPNKKLPKTRDTIEFPLPNQRKPPKVGSIVRLYEGSKQFCDLFRPQNSPVGLDGEEFFSSVLPPDGYEAIQVIERRAYSNVLKFDINNDNKQDIVVVLHMRSHPEDSDTFFVYDSKSVPQVPQDETGEELYRRSASRIFPDRWGNWTNNVTAPWWDPSDKPEFRSQYLYLWPFRWQGTTYFMTGSAEVDKAHWHFIFRPEPNNAVITMCAFQVVREHY